LERKITWIIEERTEGRKHTMDKNQRHSLPGLGSSRRLWTKWLGYFGWGIDAVVEEGVVDWGWEVRHFKRYLNFWFGAWLVELGLDLNEEVGLERSSFVVCRW
jgi:hypothetical protein